MKIKLQTYENKITNFVSNQDIIKKCKNQDQERFNNEYLGIPVSVSEKLMIEELRKKNTRLQDQKNQNELVYKALKTTNNDLRKENQKLTEENQKLKKEVEKIHNRFDILDL